MKEIDERDYARMKDFFSFYAERYLHAEGLPPEKRPMASLEALERKSLKTAFTGLRQAINDCVEMSFHLSHAEVEELDSQLRNRGIITLSELRRQYSKSYAKIIKRGRIKNETEYYLILNVLNDRILNVLNDRTEKTPEEHELLEKLISDYEAA